MNYKINNIFIINSEKEFINNDVEQGATDEASNLGLDEKEFDFFKIVKKYLDEDGNGEADFVVNEDGETYVSDETIELSKDVKNVVNDNYMIDWVTNPTKTNDIQRAIKLMLIKKYAKKLSRDVREKIMEPLLNLAKIHFDKI